MKRNNRNTERRALQRGHGIKSYARQKTWVLLSLCLPALILIILFNYIPMFGLVLAFKDYKVDRGVWGSAWVGLKNFEFFFKSEDALRVTVNTIGYNLVFIATTIIGSLVIALLLNEIRSKKALKAYQTMYFFPYFLSWSVVAYIVYAFMEFDYGILNSILEKLGMESKLWYNEARYWRVIIPLLNFWKTIGYNSIVFYAGIIGIDPTLYEAAAIDGANKVQASVKVIVPQITALIVMMTLLKVGKIFHSDFGLFYIVPLNSGSIYRATDVIDTYVYRALTAGGDTGMTVAIGMYQSVVGLFLVILSNWLVKKFSEDSAMF